MVTALRKLFGNQEVRILMVGLDNAGKTTILYKLRLHEVISTVPTIGFNVETVNYKNISFTVWDIGGQDKIRNLWRVYLKGSQGLIFVIDSSDKQRLDEARGELFKLLEEEDLQGAHVLVFANKQDVVGAATVADIRDRIGLNNVKSHNWFIQPTCALKGEGLHDGLDWLAAQIQGVKR